MPAKRPDNKTTYNPFASVTTDAGSSGENGRNLVRKQNQDVRVGYIDSERGYIDGLTVYEANKYAEKNPGTQFIHKNRDRIAYININAVNKLTNENTKPKKGSYQLVDDEGNYTDCNTVKGLITNPDGNELPNKPKGLGDVPFVPQPSSDTGTNSGGDATDDTKGIKVIVEGGGGVGCIASPVIGTDGAVIHVRVIHGGFGYRFPPQVRIFDPNQRGAGATAKAYIGAKQLIREEFDSASDVEDYDFSPSPLSFDSIQNPYGVSYSLSSNTVIGDWDPRKIISVTESTGFEQQLRDYLDFLSGFDPNKPWWTTRIEEPVKVVGGGTERNSLKAGNILFPVEHMAWAGKKDISKDLVDVEFEVYGQGTRGNRSIYYDFTAKDGSHKFRVKGVTAEGRNEKIRKDIIKVKANTTYDVKASVISGRGANSEKVEQGLLEKAGKNPGENRKFQETKRSSTIFGDIIGSLNDNDDVQVTANKGKFKASNRRIISVDASEEQLEKFKSQPNRFKRATFDLTYRVNVPGATKVTETILPSFMNTHAVCPTLPSHKKGTDMNGKLYSMIWKEQFPHDGEYTFRGICDDRASVYLDGEQIMLLPGHKGIDSKTFTPRKLKLNVKEGLHEIRIDLLNATHTKIVKRKITAKGGTSKGRVPIEFEVYGQGNKKNTAIKFIFTSLGGEDSFTIVPKRERVNNRYRYTRTVRLLPNTDYKVQAVASEEISVSTPGVPKPRERRIPIIFEDLHPKNNPILLGNKNRELRLKDGHGNDYNALFQIVTAGPNMDAKFSGNGKELIVIGEGSVTLRLKYDDNPRFSGEAVRSITIKGKTWRKKNREKGQETHTIVIGNSNTGNPPVPARVVHPINFVGLNPVNDPIKVSKNKSKLFLRDNGGATTPNRYRTTPLYRYLETTNTRYRTTPLYRYLNSTTGDHFTGLDVAAPTGYVNEGVFGHVFIGNQPPGTVALVDSEPGKPTNTYTAYVYPATGTPPFNIDGTTIATTLIYAKTNQNDVMWTNDPNEGNNLGYTIDTTNHPQGYAFYNAANPVDITVTTTGDHFTGIDPIAPAGYVTEKIIGHVFIGLQPPGTVPLIDDEEGNRSNAGKPLSSYTAYVFPRTGTPPFSIGTNQIPTTLIYAKTNQSDVMWTSDPNEGNSEGYIIGTTNHPLGYAFYNATNPIDITIDTPTGDDESATILIENVQGGTAEFTNDGRGIAVKGNVSLSVTLVWDDNPKTGGVALDNFSLDGLTWKQRGIRGSITKTVTLKGERTVKDDLLIDIPVPPIVTTHKLVPEQGTLKPKYFGKGGLRIEGGSNQSKVIFADIIGSVNDNDDMQIRCSDGIFTPSNKRKKSGVSGQGKQTRNTWDLTYRFDIDANDTRAQQIKKQLKKNGYSTDADFEKVTVFNTKDYINKSNRRLYRVFPCADQTKDFFSANAVTPFNPLELDPDFPKIVKSQPQPQKPRKPKVNFEQNGKNLKLKVTGSGKVKIGFRLKTDDNFRTSGVFAKEVQISADGPNVVLRRTITNTSGSIKEKETITAEGVFTAGKEYNIKVVGGASGSGYKTVDKTKVYFDDNIGNGFDKNGALSIRYVNVIEEPRTLPPSTPGKQGYANKTPSKRYKGDTNDYAGTHKIVWNNVRFPITGSYKIGVMVDDNVKIEIGTKQKGDVVKIYKEGFTRGNNRSTGKSEYVETIPEGNYTITAYLQQIPGRPINDGNPMGLAINIDTVFAEVEEEVIVNKSWYDNPYGAALTIHAPLPPVPPLDIVQEDSACPQNPIWTTRHNQASGEDRWIPVNHRHPDGRRSWSRFMNQYALSPILPLGTPRSGRPGETWETKWDVNIPYDGFYNFKGAVDNFATVSIGTHFIKKLDGFGTEKKDLTDHKVFLRKGRVTLGLSVTQGERKRPILIERKVFNSADWAAKPTEAPDKVSIDFDVYGQGSKKNMGLKFIFKEKGGNDTFTIDNVDTNRKVDTIRKRVKRNTDYEVTAIATGTHATKTKPAAKEKRYNIEVAERGSVGRGFNAAVVEVLNETIKFTDSTSQNDTDAEFKIVSTSPGINAKFSGSNDSNLELIVKGNGNVSLELKWKDNPNRNGKAVGELKVGGETFKQNGGRGEETRTIQVSNSNIGSADSITPTVTKRYKTTPLYRYLNSTTGDHFTGLNVAAPAGYINEGVFGHVFIGDQPPGTIQLIDDEEGNRSNAGKPLSSYTAYAFPPDAKPPFSIGGTVIQTILIYAKTNQSDVMWTSDPNEGNNLNPPYTLDTTNNPNGYAFYDAASPIDITVKVPGEPNSTITNLIPEQGTIKSGSFGKSKNEGAKESPNQSNVIFADIIGSVNDNDDMQIRCSRGIFTPSNKRKNVKGTSGQGTQKRNTWDLTFRVDAAEERATTITELNGVNYKGPELASYVTGKLGRLISPFFPLGKDQGGDLLNGKTWEMVWENVDFPESGNYDFQFEVDDIITVFVSNQESNSKNLDYKEIAKTTLTNVRENGNNPVLVKTTIQKGKRNVKVLLENADFKTVGINGFFNNNPTYFGMKIKFKDTILDEDRRSWLVNPTGVSAVLIAPPCPREVGGTGIITSIIPTNPGNSYPTTPPIEGDFVDAKITVTGGQIENPGIGYTPGDSASINDVPVDLTIGEFGKIIGIGGTLGFPPTTITRYPDIRISTSTGTNASIIPVTDIEIDPVDVDPENLIQITDLAGLKQTGYILGRAYYGEVYYENGVPFAGRYKTAGTPIQVYATLQESIDAQVTTRPSAIQRSGTDINSNNSRLNIPGTPDNLV